MQNSKVAAIIKQIGKIKKPLDKSKGFLKEYGSYLLSRIVVQYHRP
jgi:hypothetical protein